MHKKEQQNQKNPVEKGRKFQIEKETTKIYNNETLKSH